MAKEEEKKEKSRQEVLEETVAKLITLVEAQENRIAALETAKGGKKGGLFGGKRARTPTKDTKTGKVYPSKAATAKAVAAEFNLDPADSMAWYTIIAKDPERFVEASEEEAVKAEAELKALQEKDQAERQAKLDAEAKKAKK